MATEDDIAKELRNELEARIAAWKAERAKLQLASARIAELTALIDFADDPTRTQFTVAPRPVVPIVSIIAKNATPS